MTTAIDNRTVEYRSIDELQAAIRDVEAALSWQRVDAGEANPIVRQIRVTTSKGF